MQVLPQVQKRMFGIDDLGIWEWAASRDYHVTGSLMVLTTMRHSNLPFVRLALKGSNTAPSFPQVTGEQMSF